ncbi:hypothetical protein Pmani_029957 [Petrolisthes manimaculis]|uniref:Uncharacterized protein n=1 Tax=Petrolisthes manimaculis TaxID=1843537 RepID=A0AAE1NXR7_9EUCA|nr:hypothetical protein Pmani_029957 [Petrolisthes manimaculis]
MKTRQHSQCAIVYTTTPPARHSPLNVTEAALLITLLLSLPSHLPPCLLPRPDFRESVTKLPTPPSTPSDPFSLFRGSSGQCLSSFPLPFRHHQTKEGRKEGEKSVSLSSPSADNLYIQVNQEGLTFKTKGFAAHISLPTSVGYYSDNVKYLCKGRECYTLVRPFSHLCSAKYSLL